MNRRSLRSRAPLALAAVLLGASLLAVIPTANAAPSAPDGVGAPAALNDNGPIAADAAASLVQLGIGMLSPAILPQTNIDLGASAVRAASDQDLDAGQSGAQRSAAVGSLLYNSNLLGQDLAELLDGLINNNSASAPASEAHDAELLALPLDPLLNLPVINSHVEANWESDVECVAADTPMSLANQTTADATLLNIADGQSVLELGTEPGQGAVDTEVSTHLVEIAGDGDPRAVQARARTNISGVNLLNGLAGPGTAIDVEVAQAPNYVVQASGLPGGASVTGDRPIVHVTLAGDQVITLDDNNPTASATLTDLTLGDLIEFDGSLVVDLLEDVVGGPLPDELSDLLSGVEGAIQDALDGLSPVVQLSIPYTETVAADGTSASVESSVLRVEVLPPAVLDREPIEDLLGGALGVLFSSLVDPLTDQVLDTILGAIGGDLTQPLVQVDVAPMSASVQAPAGGINCEDPDEENPLRELNKHASATEVAPGGIFEYNISVPNRGPCALTDVVVSDTVEGPGTIVATEPEADTVDGNVATWEIGDLAVNETVNLTVTVQVDEDAPDGATFDDFVIAVGNCNGREVEQPDVVTDIPRVVDNFTGPCSVQFSNKDTSHESVFVGETFSYYVHAYNTGAEACNDVTITDTLDERVTFVDCNKGCTNDGQTVTWNLDSIPGGSSVILSVVVEVNDGASGVLGNTAVIDPSNGDPKTVSVTGPTIGLDSVIKDPAPAARGPLNMPRTGGTTPLALALAAGLGAVGLLALRRRSAIV